MVLANARLSWPSTRSSSAAGSRPGAVNGPVEDYTARFDELFCRLAQWREGRSRAASLSRRRCRPSSLRAEHSYQQKQLKA